MRYHAYDCLAVERILRARFCPRTLEQCLHQKSAEKLRDALPKIEQRSLSEYSVLMEPRQTEPSPFMEEPDDQNEE
jgi:hypothetical protein